MSFIVRTDDPISDYGTWVDECEREAKKYPVCFICDQHITDEDRINYGGTYFHEECFLNEYREWNEPLEPEREENYYDI